MEPNQLSSIGKRLFSMVEFDEEEVLLTEIRKHPFGLFIIYLTGFAIAFAVFMTFIIAPLLLGGDSFGLGEELAKLEGVFNVIAFFIFILTFIGTGIGAYLYKNDVIFLTSEKIAQVLYKSIFNRKISQLSIGDVQDVTVNQIGIFSRIFNFGTIVIETAGEQANYSFSYVPDPYAKAKEIVGAHELNLKKYGN